MRTRLAPLLVVVALWLSGCPAGPPVEQQLAEAYGQMNKAFSEEDSKTLMAMLTDDFEWITPEGRRLPRAVVPTQLQSTWELGKCRAETQIESVEADGRRATATVRDHTTIEGTSAAGGPFRAEIDEKREDVWVSSESGWKLRSQRTLEVKKSVNGQPVE